MSINQIPVYTLYTSEKLVSAPADPTPHLVNSDLLMGVEYEVEDYEGDLRNGSNSWSVHNDASLRNGVEFVFSRPLSGAAAVSALQDFERSDHTFVTSERTSTHIHFNAADGCTIGQVRSLFALMYMIEPAVFRIASEDRKWCSYCQPLTDYSPQRLIRLLASSDLQQFAEAARGERHQDKYYGMNMSSLSRHTTIEFRYFPGVANFEATLKWINLLQTLRSAAYSTHDPRVIVHACSSAESLRHYIRDNLGPFAEEVLSNLVIEDAVQRASALEAICSADRSSARMGNGANSEASRRMLGALEDEGSTKLRECISKFLGVQFRSGPPPIDTSTPQGKIAAIFQHLDEEEAATVMVWSPQFGRDLRYVHRHVRTNASVVQTPTVSIQPVEVWSGRSAMASYQRLSASQIFSSSRPS